jgi:TonB family protein
MTLLTLLLNPTAKISLIVLAALAATAMLPRRSAAVRHFVLAAALACAAATPAIRLVAPAWQSRPAWLTTSRVELIDRPLAVFDDSTGSTPSTPSRATRARSSGGLNAGSVVGALGIIWITGAGLAVFVILAGVSRLSTISTRARRIVNGPWAEAAADIAKAYGLRSTPVILQSDQASLLGTWGVVRAQVLLPADAHDWPSERIRIVLAHELAHVRRGDWIVQMAASLLCAAYWFNPLIWLASRRLCLESEQACDDAVLRFGVENSQYASALVDLARTFTSPHVVPAVAIARPSSLERRVRAMLNVQLNREPITRSASVAAALVLAALTVLVAGFGVAAQTSFASVSGAISDQNGRPIAGARLVLSNPAAQTKHEVKSDADGRYEIIGLPAGSYELMFEYPGMAYLKREGLNLSGDARQVNAVMRIGTIEETIRVVDTPDGPRSAPSLVDYSGGRAERPDPCAASAQGGCIRPPTKTRHVSPVYPAGSAGGTVELRGHIDANGLVAGLEVKSAPDPALSAAAMIAVNGWEFTPTHLDGQPIETPLNVHISFAASAAAK